MRTPLACLLAAALLLGCESSAPDRTAAAPPPPRPHRSFGFVYNASVPQVPPGAKSTRLWVPVPINTSAQAVSDLDITVTVAGHEVSGSAQTIAATRSIGGVPVTCLLRDIRNGTGRTLCIETTDKPIALQMTFWVTRYESHGGGMATPDQIRKDLQPDAMIPLDGKVSVMAATLPTESSNTATAHALYEHILGRMKYEKPATNHDWGHGNAEWACDSRYGNCTDFHSYFIGLARSKKVPARFEIGFPVPAGKEKVAKIGGYHCWAFFYSEEKGWVPLDISEASKDPAKASYFFGTIDDNRVMMTGGRDLVLDPEPAAGPRNFFVYPYAEVDGKPVKVEKSFSRILP